ncbi:MAG TPA: phosphoribosylanthranilate isomerase [Opitutae bacterium]|nr:phosphoribosylanthranilate isomerase [Opitutae bacterium]HAF59168.1 phosphoribosylanthranilate isomerase [Opitutae bacterium]|tara:strand:- start:1821 stop:2462 length:642 start_codon:yes stop_codon:yes gene_type:complete
MSTLVKFCGITRSSDAQLCIDLGADALGFIFHPQSPRNLSLPQFQNLQATVDFKTCVKVAVAVSPDVRLVNEFIDAGFEKFQFHYPAELPIQKISEWSSLVGRENLWLAPRLKPSEQMVESSMEFANVVLIDAYSQETFGGTGKRADWSRFVQLKKQFTDHQWFLAGGLSPNNLQEAILNTAPDGLDLNSGVEIEPGKKDKEKIYQVFSLLSK